MTTRARLRRQLGLKTAAALVVGEVLGVGIFLTPAGMAKSLGSPALVLLVWLLMGVMALCGALCYGELAARYPEAGGGYVYLREAFGAPVAFLYGWMALLVMDPGLTAALAAGLASYAGYSLKLTAVGVKLVGVAAIILLAAVNVRGVRLGAGFVRWLTLIKVGLLAFVLLWGFVFRLGDWSNFAPLVARRAGSAPLDAALAGGIASAFFSEAGWWDVSKLAGEVREPARTLPRALVFGVLAVTLIYILTSAAFIYLVPLEHIPNGELAATTFAAQAGEALFGPTGGQIFSAVVIFAVLGSLAVIIMSAPRVYFAMARDRLFFQSAAALHPRYGTPARAIVMQAALASLLVLTGEFDQIIGYFVFAVVLFVGLTVAGLFVVRRKSAGGPEYATPLYPITPVVFLLLTLLLLALLAAGGTKEAAKGVGVVALGLPVYYLFFRRDRAAHDRNGEEN